MEMNSESGEAYKGGTCGGIKVMGKSQKTLASTYATMCLTSVCILQVVFPGIGWNALSLYSVPLIQEWGITRATFSLSITLVALANSFISMFFYGVLYERLGMRKLIIVGGVVSAIGYGVFAAASNMIMVYLGCILFGIGCSMVNTKAVYAACEKWYKKDAATHMSIAQTAGSISGIIAATVIGMIIVTVGWRISLVFTALLFVVTMVICYVLYKGDPDDLGVKPLGADISVAACQPDEPKGEGTTLGETLKDPRFWLLGAIMAVIGITGYSVMANLPLIAMDHGLADSAGMMVSAALLGSAVYLIPLGRIFDLKGSVWGVGSCFVLLAVACLILLFVPANTVTMLIAAFMAGAAYDMCMSTSGVVTMEVFGCRDYAKKMGILYAIVCIGAALGPTLMNLTYGLMGPTYELALISLIAFSAVTPLCMRKLMPSSKQQG